CTEPESGRSKPLTRLTRVDLPAPLGPIRPTTSPRPTASVTPASARTPSKERETAEARRVSPSLRSASICESVDKLDLRNDLRDDQPDDPRDVVLDLDHAVLPAEDRVQLRREAH